MLKIDDVVMRHLAVRHVEGSRTSAPRDETPAPAPVAAAVPAPVAAAVPAPDYAAESNTRSDEEEE